MATVSKKTIEHFTHPQHKLVELSADTEFSCDGCKTPGQGTRYHCSPCGFDLHDYCGTCPRTLKSFMHPHSLSLVQRKSQSTRQNERTCDVCSDPVNGIFYQCEECDFDLHPLCTQLPQELKHAMHQVHHLKLESTLASPCALCGKPCNSWRYRCGVCYFDIHLECVLLTPSPPATKDRGIPMKDQWGVPHPPTSPTHHPMNIPFGNHGLGVPGHLHPPNPWLDGYGMPGHHHQQPYQFQPPPHPPTSPTHHPMNTPFGNHGFGVPGHLHPPNPWLDGYGMPGHHHQQPYQFQPPPHPPTSPTHHPMNTPFGNHGFGVPGHLHPPNPWLDGYGMPGHHHQQPYQFQPPPHPPTSPTHHPMNTPFGNHGFGVPGHLHPPNPWLDGYGMPGHHHQQPYQFQPPPHPPTSPTHHPMNTPFGNHGFGVPGHLHPPNPWLDGYGMPAHHQQQPYQFQPPPPWMYGGYGYGVPYTPPSPNINNASPHGQEGGSGNGNMGKKMFKIVGRLTMGVLSCAVFGAPFFG